MAERHPDQIMADLQQALAGRSDLDAMELVFEVVDDVRSSYRLALEDHLTAGQIAAVETTIDDYIGNHYGD
ncbi:hypothetical protein [Gordonia sihwensis]|uniref:hypothetical protein n=1 Tax=Gordonia sihwensis TaxID=173559 RepID=UPI003D99C064